jgi:phenylpyruvate tautomerase PptA (4-oxalocrotonate tautomerase family)
VAQVKVYGHREHLERSRARLSDIIHACVVDALAYPPDKRFHRFFPLDPGDFIHPPDRSERYTIVEISLFEGRSIEAKKALIRLLYGRTGADLGLAPDDLEITLFETPRHAWGIRGQPGDELGLTYKVDV